MSRVFILVFVLALSAPEGAWGRSRKKSSHPLDALGNWAEQALIAAPVDQETCFSPDEPCDVKLVKFIQSAAKSLDVAIFDLTLDQIAHHLLVQSKKIPVRVVVDKRQSKGQHSLVRTLIKGGVAVRLGSQRGVMHNKFTIVDGRRIETGSFNYSNNAARNNNENQVYLDSPMIVARFKKRFETLWLEGRPAE